ncbi:DNA uptake/competence protein ComA [Legionella beliardensis]|uniref:DNA uptake/competence protein ComA n=1 Tax=Legionella beliardensis TaxID=91822 RepID=A0A378HZQ5_9GAMM|nr:DNA internalization-related competence protein ComEC/Rec2 [Legionella beliardensis]STX28418.1 DNA uptake/competence protein ComA [Legionella beliardensis]
MEILCFVAGVIWFYTKSFYPLLFIGIALYLKAPKRIIIWFGIAILWTSFHQWWLTDKYMPASRVIQQATLIGEIVSIPMTSDVKTQFNFRLSKLNGKPTNTLVSLACYNHCPAFKLGQLWQVNAKLKRPENLGNPGHFPYQESLAARHIYWTGYLKGRAQLLSVSHKTNMTSIRERWAAKLASFLPDKTSLGIMEALTLGLTNHIDKATWDLFRRTGTTHLMVISGAHIYLVASLFYGMIYWSWRQVSVLCLYKPAMQVAGLSGVLMGLMYALLSGFAIPAQRAVIACAVLLLRPFLSRQFSGWQAWRYALLIVVIAEPHAVLLPGFYLSFLAVAVLITSSQRIAYQGVKRLIALQFACLIGLLPFTLYWFSYGAINGLLANLIAIPLVGYLIVPISLLGLLLSVGLGQLWVLPLVDWSIKGLLMILHGIDQAAFINLNFSLPNFSILLALILAIAVLFFLPLKALIPGALILLLAALFPGFPKIKPADARIDVLDVGQGLAIVISTAKHVLLYDTGMKFYQGSDMAQMAIIPYLTTRGVKKINKIIISHPDLDHRGGLPSLEEKYGQVELLVDNVTFYQRGNNCHTYPDWEWDGVYFHFLPIHLPGHTKNNSSCVLQITTSSGKALLTGDIEKPAEHYLMTHYAKQLAADVLVVAHHASKTSSTPAFIKHVAPKLALISAGFDNRYHFPHPQTIATLTKQHINILNTIDCGMITIEFNQQQKAIKPACYRNLS